MKLRLTDDGNVVATDMLPIDGSPPEAPKPAALPAPTRRTRIRVPPGTPILEMPDGRQIAIERDQGKVLGHISVWEDPDSMDTIIRKRVDSVEEERRISWDVLQHCRDPSSAIVAELTHGGFLTLDELGVLMAQQRW